MGYRIPEPPLDPPERRLTADDIEELVDEAKTLREKVYGASYYANTTRIQAILDDPVSNSMVSVVAWLENALELAREYEEGE
jgi:hypothetical protein